MVIFHSYVSLPEGNVDNGRIMMDNVEEDDGYPLVNIQKNYGEI